MYYLYFKIKSLLKMLDLKLPKTAFYSILISFSGSLVMFVVNIIFVNILSDNDLGQYTIVRTSIILFPLIIFLGFGNSLIRFHRHSNIFEYNWKKPIIESLLYASILCIPFIVIFNNQYHFSYFQNILLFSSCILLGRLLLSSALLRISEQYVVGIVIKNIWRLVFIFILLSALYLKGSIDITSILIVIILSIFLAIMLALNKEKNIPFGTKKIKYSLILSSGFMFFLLGSSDVFLSQFDKLLIGADLILVGKYNAISILPFVGFNLTASSIGTVLMPYIINNSKSFSYYKKYIIIFCFIIVPASIYLVLNIVGADLVSIIYRDKYTDIDNLFFYCNILGAIQYLQVLAYFLIGATLSDKSIKIITILNVLIILGTYPLYNLLESGGNLINAVTCFILIWSLRFLISIFFLLRKNVESDKF
ncbi:MAG: hypothetical protein CMG13_04135 [Candidatus Marinimicrobia bacterium]|nr:hypothetical protein [Candidatus Neomarinimicrobiota bacterium]